MPALTIEALSKAFGAVAAIDRVSLAVEDGEMLVLLGPSGCGKTTLLRCLGGLERPSAGRISIGERVVTGVEERIFVPPEKREIGMVFQTYAIWPHMTVFENVAYPLRAIGLPREAIRSKVDEALRLVRLGGLAARYSSEISGGQQQRVALARSLVGAPKLLLFDEPLSNLDANLRVEMRVEIRELQQRLGFTSVYVTHDQTEAMAIADRIAIMEGGVLRQIGCPRTIYERPADPFVASFMGGTNLLDGVVASAAGGHAVVCLGDGLDLHLAAADTVRAGDPVRISVRPEALDLLRERPNGQANVWPATIAGVSFLGNAIVYKARIGRHEIEVHARPSETHDPGATVFVAAPPERCVLFGRQSGEGPG